MVPELLQATKQVCGVSSNHPWRMQTWWWNNQVEEAVREKRRCFKLWKAGGSRAAQGRRRFLKSGTAIERRKHSTRA